MKNQTPYWRQALRDALFEQPMPIFSAGATTIPAASIWTGSRLWTKAFREADLVFGDVIAIDVVAGPICAQIITAALWEGLVFAVLDRSDISTVALPPGARLVISDRHLVTALPTWGCLGIGGPEVRSAAARIGSDTFVTDGDSEIAMLSMVKTDAAETIWEPVTDTSLQQFLTGHLPSSRYDESVIVSTLSWSRPEDLVAGFLAPLLGGAAHLVQSDSRYLDNACSIHTPDRVLLAA
jgi:hypothetical protein